jgi:hypothetical protein
MSSSAFAAPQEQQQQLLLLFCWRLLIVLPQLALAYLYWLLPATLLADPCCLLLCLLVQ